MAGSDLVRETEQAQVKTAPARVNVRLADYFSYRGGPGMWAWLAHRLTGLGVIVFLFFHVVDTALIGWGPSAYNTAIHLYRKLGFRIGEMILAVALLCHSMNGIRIVVIDFWPQKTDIQKKLLYALVALFVVLAVPTVVIMIAWMLR